MTMDRSDNEPVLRTFEHRTRIQDRVPRIPSVLCDCFEVVGSTWTLVDYLPRESRGETVSEKIYRCISEKYLALPVCQECGDWGGRFAVEALKAYDETAVRVSLRNNISTVKAPLGVQSCTSWETHPFAWRAGIFASTVIPPEHIAEILDYADSCGYEAAKRTVEERMRDREHLVLRQQGEKNAD